MNRLSLCVAALFALHSDALTLMRGDSDNSSEVEPAAQKEPSIVWIPSWPRAGSTTIFHLALSASWEAEEPGDDVAEALEDRGRGGSKLITAMEPPSEPGCWVLTPSGCPGRGKLSFADERWTRDVESGADKSRTRCEKRRSVYNNRCNVTDSAVVFVPGENYEASPFKKHFGIFEPCHKRYGNKTKPDLLSPELEGNCKLNMERLFRCDFTGMDWLWGWSRPHSDITGVTVLGANPPNYSQELAHRSCSTSDLIVYKTVDEFGRNASDVINMLEAHKNVKALVPVRDPRAIYASWKELPWDWPGVQLLKDICDEMALDLNVYHDRLLKIPLEKLTMNPEKVTRHAYKFLGFEFGRAQMRWIRSTFNATCSETAQDGNKFYSCHENSDSLERWRTVLSKHEKGVFNSYHSCIQTAKHYGYELGSGQ